MQPGSRGGPRGARARGLSVAAAVMSKPTRREGARSSTAPAPPAGAYLPSGEKETLCTAPLKWKWCSTALQTRLASSALPPAGKESRGRPRTSHAGIRSWGPAPRCRRHTAREDTPHARPRPTGAPHTEAAEGTMRAWTPRALSVGLGSAGHPARNHHPMPSPPVGRGRLPSSTMMARRPSGESPTHLMLYRVARGRVSDLLLGNKKPEKKPKLSCCSCAVRRGWGAGPARTSSAPLHPSPRPSRPARAPDSSTAPPSRGRRSKTTSWRKFR